MRRLVSLFFPHTSRCQVTPILQSDAPVRRWFTALPLSVLSASSFPVILPVRSTPGSMRCGLWRSRARVPVSPRRCTPAGPEKRRSSSAGPCRRRPATHGQCVSSSRINVLLRGICLRTNKRTDLTQTTSMSRAYRGPLPRARTCRERRAAVHHRVSERSGHMSTVKWCEHVQDHSEDVNP